MSFFVSHNGKLFFLCSLHTEAGKSAPSSNGQNAVVSDTACPPTSGHLMAQKMRLGRQDQEETDTGTLLMFCL